MVVMAPPDQWQIQLIMANQQPVRLMLVVVPVINHCFGLFQYFSSRLIQRNV